MKRAIAILCSDLHLRETVPPARSAEPDWFAAMERVLLQLRAAQEYHDDCPIILAGDLFHKATPPVGLVNWFIGLRIPHIYAIPGQHDLPYHALDDIKKSGYWTLVEAGAIKHLTEGKQHFLPAEARLVIYAFPWGVPIKLPENAPANSAKLAVIHHYIHDGGGTCHPGASPDDHVDAFADRLEGFDVALFGDNHCPFVAKSGECLVVNNGGMMLTKSDDRKGSPGYSLLYSDGTVERCIFDTSEDRWVEDSIAAETANASEIGHALIESLVNLSSATIDYREGIKQAIRTLSPSAGVQRVLLDAIA